METLLHYVETVFFVLIWIYIVGPFLLVVPAFQISYLGGGVRNAEDNTEKIKCHLLRLLMWFIIGIWALGLVGILLYQGGAFPL